MVRRNHTWRLLILFILAGTLLYLLWWRWQVSATRFFDVDEMSYLHWTAQVARGERQYVDFFSYFTPGFFWVFAPIYWVIGASSQVLTAGRMVALGIFIGILGCLGYVFGQTRGWKWALLPAVILAFLPMPYDKFLEIRPDNLATLLVLIGIITEVHAIQRKKQVWWIVSGLVYSASLFVLVKTLPIVLVGAVIALISRNKHFFLGLLSVWVVFFAGALVLGQFHETWYSLTKLVFEVSRNKLSDQMVSTLFFFPNASFYGGNNTVLSTGLFANHAIWILAIFVGTYRLLTPFHKKYALAEILTAGACFVSIFIYVKFFPLKHSQYLIPIAVFIAYYAADGLAAFFDWLARVGGNISMVVLLIGFVTLISVVTKDVNQPKLMFTNTSQITELTKLLQTIPLTARVVDLEGKMFFWREGYPICCVPFDYALPDVTEGPAPLALYLESHPADYLYDGDSGRLVQLSPSNAAYIRQHFTPLPEFGQRLWKRIP